MATSPCWSPAPTTHLGWGWDDGGMGCKVLSKTWEQRCPVRRQGLESTSPECAPLHVLPTEPHVDALLQQGAEGHVLSQCPVHCPLPGHVCSGTQDAGQACREGAGREEALRGWRPGWDSSDRHGQAAGVGLLWGPDPSPQKHSSCFSWASCPGWGITHPLNTTRP